MCVLSVAAFFALNQFSSAEIALNLVDTSKHKIELSEPAQEINNDLFDSKEEMMKYYLQDQKKMDIEDIKVLWESTVKRNPVITFALQKLSLPPDKRRITSSRMTKTLATLIRGAAMLPGILGADPVTSGASSFGGGLAGRYIADKNLPKQMPMTDTELIHLARLVEDLQDKIIRNYYDYKGNLEAYKVARENTIKFNKMYSDALESDEFAVMLTSNTLYNKAMRTEIEIKQKIKLNRLELERLAGGEEVTGLNLGKTSLLEDLKAESIDKKEGPPVPQVVEGKVESDNLDIRALAREIADEMEDERKEILADLQILWEAGVENSETIRFAILKLSNPNGDVEKKTLVKQILSPLASVAPIVGLGLGDPVSAGTAMFSGNLLTSVLSDDSKINAHLSKVTDADLVLLAQETDSLQEKLIVLYHNYLSSLMDLMLVENMEQASKDYMDAIKISKPELVNVADVFYNETLDLKYRAQQDVLSKRVALEQFAGNDALFVVDKNLQDRLGYNL